MTFKIERHEFAFYTGKEINYAVGEQLNVQISACLGLDTKPAILESLPKGRGFIVGNRVIRPPNYIWIDEGWAVAT